MSGDIFVGASDKSTKPCRACTDFKQWMKVGPEKPPNANEGKPGKDQKSKLEESTDLDQSIIDRRSGLCPPDRGELGSSSWSLLHSLAAYFPSKPSVVEQEEAKQFMHLFSKLYPCHDCAEDLKKDLIDDPPKVASSDEFSQWMCELHNKVNLKLGKPIFDCSKVFQRWRDGWSDGSCD